MSKNMTLASIAILTLTGIVACEPAGTDEDPAARPSYQRESPDREPKYDESATEKAPADDVSDMP